MLQCGVMAMVGREKHKGSCVNETWWMGGGTCVVGAWGAYERKKTQTKRCAHFISFPFRFRCKSQKCPRRDNLNWRKNEAYDWKIAATMMMWDDVGWGLREKVT